MSASALTVSSKHSTGWTRDFGGHKMDAELQFCPVSQPPRGSRGGQLPVRQVEGLSHPGEEHARGHRGRQDLQKGGLPKKTIDLWPDGARVEAPSLSVRGNNGDDWCVMTVGEDLLVRPQLDAQGLELRGFLRRGYHQRGQLVLSVQRWAKAVSKHMLECVHYPSCAKGRRGLPLHQRRQAPGTDFSVNDTPWGAREASFSRCCHEASVVPLTSLPSPRQQLHSPWPLSLAAQECKWHTAAGTSEPAGKIMSHGQQCYSWRNIWIIHLFALLHALCTYLSLTEAPFHVDWTSCRNSIFRYRGCSCFLCFLWVTRWVESPSGPQSVSYSPQMERNPNPI